MKYYVEEHEIGYQRIRAEGKAAWNEIHGEPGFDFSLRTFLEKVLPRLNFSTPNPKALEIGCGTGPGACFLAERGFQVLGIDITPLAIEMAEKFAAQRNLPIHYEVQDACNIPLKGELYDLVVDNYCLQCIVTDSDRKKLFSAVKSRLKPDGFYIIGTAVYRKDRDYDEDDVFDRNTGIQYIRLKGDPNMYEDALMISDKWYLPHRRHLKPIALSDEIESHEFDMIFQEGGELICRISSSVIYS